MPRKELQDPGSLAMVQTLALNGDPALPQGARLSALAPLGEYVGPYHGIPHVEKPAREAGHSVRFPSSSVPRPLS